MSSSLDLFTDISDATNLIVRLGYESGSVAVNDAVSALSSSFVGAINGALAGITRPIERVEEQAKYMAKEAIATAIDFALTCPFSYFQFPEDKFGKPEDIHSK